MVWLAMSPGSRPARCSLVWPRLEAGAVLARLAKAVRNQAASDAADALSDSDAADAAEAVRDQADSDAAGAVPDRRTGDAVPHHVDDSRPGGVPDREAGVVPGRVTAALPDHAAGALSDRVFDALADHVADALADRVADAVPDRVIGAVPDRVIGGMIGRHPGAASRFVARRVVLIAATMACGAVLGSLLDDGFRVEPAAIERTAPGEVRAPVIVATPTLPVVPVAPVPVAPRLEVQEARPPRVTDHADGPRHKHMDGHRGVRRIGRANGRGTPVPLGDEPPPWATP
jgi:hypothetical protein